MMEAQIERDNDDLSLRIDQLVDGELSAEDQRALLMQLDAEPGHWRRLALAFVEAQSLRQSCREYVAPTISAALPVEYSAPLRALHLSRIAASAAALLMAFVLGGMTGRNWPEASIVARKDAAPPPLTTADTPTNPVEPVSAVPVAFRYGDGTTTEPVSTPVIDASSPEAQAWLQASQGVPERVRELLRRQGQKLEERQEWVEIQLEDGRKGYMPVQEWVVAPVSLADFR